MKREIPREHFTLNYFSIFSLRFLNIPTRPSNGHQWPTTPAKWTFLTFDGEKKISKGTQSFQSPPIHPLLPPKPLVCKLRALAHWDMLLHAHTRALPLSPRTQYVWRAIKSLFRYVEPGWWKFSLSVAKDQNTTAWSAEALECLLRCT